MAQTKKKKKVSKKESRALGSDHAATYNEFKEFEGRRYMGMRIGRAHKWYYDSGVWKEKKITPDEWQIDYNVTKRRAGKAPKGSGAPVGTGYHWYIIAHQNVTKLNANDYSTSMTGLKFKIAHKRADREGWSVSEKTQRKKTIQILKDLLTDLEKEQAAEEPARKSAEAKNRRKRLKAA